MTENKMETIKVNELRCQHRHTIKEHPHCFYLGKIKGQSGWKSESEYVKKTGNDWFTFPDYKMGFLDIESDGLKADFATMLTWCIKEKDGKIYHDEITKEELFEGKGDERIIRSLIDTLNQFRIICGYFSTNFDVPFVRAKALHYGMEFPNYGALYHFDLYYLVKSKLCLSRKSLDNVCDYLGIEGKTPIDKDVWRAAKYGDPKAIHQVLLHNMGDVKISEKLYEKLIDTSKWTRRSL